MEQKESKELNQGVIEAYIHQNKKIGAMVDLRCETDFVARTDEFKTLAHELCLQIAAMRPQFINPEDIPGEFLEKEKNKIKEELQKSGKPAKLIEEIVGGKLEKLKKEICLLSQPWIKDGSKTIGDLVQEYKAQLKEEILVKRFIRLEI